MFASVNINIMKLLTKFFGGLLIILICAGCVKSAGLGGRAKIKGKLTGSFYYDDQLLMANGSGILNDEDVYIVYGTDDTYFDDDIKTSYDGSFEFNYLRPGTYTVFFYENCFPCAGLQSPKLMTVEITEKDAVIDLGTINLKKKI